MDDKKKAQVEAGRKKLEEFRQKKEKRSTTPLRRTVDGEVATRSPSPFGQSPGSRPLSAPPRRGSLDESRPAVGSRLPRVSDVSAVLDSAERLAGIKERVDPESEGSRRPGVASPPSVFVQDGDQDMGPSRRNAFRDGVAKLAIPEDATAAASARDYDGELQQGSAGEKAQLADSVRRDDGTEFSGVSETEGNNVVTDGVKILPTVPPQPAVDGEASLDSTALEADTAHSSAVPQAASAAQTASPFSAGAALPVPPATATAASAATDTQGSWGTAAYEGDTHTLQTSGQPQQPAEDEAAAAAEEEAAAAELSAGATAEAEAHLQSLYGVAYPEYESTQVEQWSEVDPETLYEEEEDPPLQAGGEDFRPPPSEAPSEQPQQFGGAWPDQAESAQASELSGDTSAGGEAATGLGHGGKAYGAVVPPSDGGAKDGEVVLASFGEMGHYLHSNQRAARRADVGAESAGTPTPEFDGFKPDLSGDSPSGDVVFGFSDSFRMRQPIAGEPSSEVEKLAEDLKKANAEAEKWRIKAESLQEEASNALVLSDKLYSAETELYSTRAELDKVILLEQEQREEAERVKLVVMELEKQLQQKEGVSESGGALQEEVDRLKREIGEMRESYEARLRTAANELNDITELYSSMQEDMKDLDELRIKILTQNGRIKELERRNLEYEEALVAAEEKAGGGQIATEKLARMAEEVEESRERVEAALHEMAQLSRHLSERDQELTEAIAAKESLEEEVATINDERREAEKKLGMIQDDCDEYRSTLDSTRAELDALHAREELLKKKLAAYEKDTGEADAEKARKVSALEEELKQSQEAVAKLEGEVKGLHFEKSTLVEMHEEEMQGMSSELDGLRQRVDTLEAARLALEKQVEEGNAKVADLEQRLEAAGTASAEARALRLENESMEKEIESMHEEMSSKEDQVADLERRLADVAEGAASVSSANWAAEKEDLEKQLLAAEAAKLKVDAQLAELAEAAVELETVRKQLQEEEAARAKVEEKGKKVASERKKLKERVAELEADLAREKEEAQQQIDVLQQKLAEVNEESNSFQERFGATMADREMEVERLRNQVEDLTRELGDRMQATDEEIAAMRVAHDAEVRKGRESQAKLLEQIDSLSELSEQLQSQLEASEQALATEKANLQSLEAEHSQALEALNSLLQKASADNRNLKEQCKEVETICRDLEKERLDLLAQVSDKTKEAAAAAAAKLEADAALTAAREQLEAEAADRGENTEQELATLRQELEEVNYRLQSVVSERELEERRARAAEDLAERHEAKAASLAGEVARLKQEVEVASAQAAAGASDAEEVAALRQQLDEKSMSEQAFVEDIRSLQALLAEKDAVTEQLQAEVARLQEAVEEAEANRTSAEETLADLNLAYKAQVDKQRQLEERLERLKEEAVSREGDQGRLASLQGDVEELNQALTDAEGEIASLRQQLEQERQHSTAAREEAAATEAAARELEERLRTEAEASITALTSELEQAEGRLAELEAAAASAQGLQEAANKQAADAAATVRHVQELESALDQANAENDGLRQELGALNESLERQNAENDGLRQGLGALNERLESQNALTREVFEEKEMYVGELETLVAKMELEMNEKAAIVAEKEQLAAAVEQANAALATAQQLSVQAEEQAASLKLQYDALYEDYETHLSTVKSQGTEQESQARALQQALDMKEIEMVEMRSVIEQLEAEKEAAEARLSAVTDRLSEVEKETTQLHMVAAGRAQELEDASNRERQLQDYVQGLEEHSTTKDKAIADMQAKLTKAEEDHTRHDADAIVLERMMRETRELTSRAEAAESKAGELDAMLREAERRTAEALEARGRMAEEYAQALEVAETQAESLSDAEQRWREAVRSLNESEQRYQATTQRIQQLEAQLAAAEAAAASAATTVGVEGGLDTSGIVPVQAHSSQQHQQQQQHQQERVARQRDLSRMQTDLESASAEVNALKRQLSLERKSKEEAEALYASVLARQSPARSNIMTGHKKDEGGETGYDVETGAGIFTESKGQTSVPFRPLEVALRGFKNPTLRSPPVGRIATGLDMVYLQLCNRPVARAVVSAYALIIHMILWLAITY